VFNSCFVKKFYFFLKDFYNILTFMQNFIQNLHTSLLKRRNQKWRWNFFGGL